ncbi:MAG: hypothetical protein GVY14_14315 [Spirochaetes bacterium]|jgi:hypothetical protein|nr:hypothetical protein [Spirochaetota bacterium]
MHRTHRFPAPIATLILVLAGIVLAPAAASAQVWLNSYDEGLAAARESGRPLVLFITAPGWCEPCERFEAEVLSDDLVGDILRKEFVTVRLTDRDPEHARFEFPGYPSFLVFHPTGRRLGAFHAPDTIREFRAELDRYQRPLAELLAEADPSEEADTVEAGDSGGGSDREVAGGTEAAGAADAGAATAGTTAAGAAAAAYRYPGGVFVRLQDGSWVRETAGERTLFTEYREDDRYAYLKPSDGEDADGDDRAGGDGGGGAGGAEGFFAIPKDGGQAFRWDSEREAWESAWRVTAPEER